MDPAKFLPPRPTRILERDRLLDRLSRWEDRKLIVIHGQAGQGKTMLAAAYCRSLASPVVWYTMDREDCDPAYFLSSLAAALQRAFPGDLTRSGLSPGQRGPVDPAAAARAWADRHLAPLSRPCLVVLDDLHTAAGSPALPALLLALVEASPPAVRFLVLSRTRPDLDTARLTARRSYGEFTGVDLRFSTPEVEELYASVFGMHLTPEIAALINRSAEGWPAGLVLMHQYLATASPERWDRILADRAGTRMQDRIFDYLAQDVFRHLPDELQRFLMRTSLSDVMPLTLAGGLTGLRPHAVSVCIDELVRRNLFITRLDSGVPAISYHSLFRDFLQKRLLACETARTITVLAGNASTFFSRAGDPVRAVDALLTLGQEGKALVAISGCAGELIGRGQAATLLRWHEALHPAAQRGPWFLLARAICCRFTDPKAALELFNKALAGFRSRGSGPEARTGALLALCGIVEECFHAGGDFKRMEQAATLAGRLLGRNSRAAAPARARLLLAMGMAWFFTGSLAKSRESLLQALALFNRQGDAFFQVTCALYLTPCALYQGDFRLARETLRRGFDAHKTIPDEAGGLAGLYLTQAMAALFEGRFSEARQNIDHCKQLAGVHSLASITLLSLTIGGWLATAEGDLAAAETMLAECKQQAAAAGNAFFAGSAAHLWAIALLFGKKLKRAERESNEALAIRSGKGSRLFHAVYLIASGAIQLQLGNLERAGRELRSALGTLKQAGAVQQEANCHLVLAMLEREQGNSLAFRSRLRQAFSLGRELGFTYYAVLTPDEQAALARVAIAENICRDYCESLLESRRTGRPLLSIFCMGRFAVLRGARPVRQAEWKSPRARTLLKLLVAHEGQRLPREQVMDLLWPGDEGRKSPAVFNALLHRLRQAVEPGASKDVFCIQQEEGMVGLNRDVVWTDAGQISRHLEKAARLRAEGRKAELLEEYERAIGLYEGDFLADDAYCDWSAPLRDRLRADYLRALEGAGRLAEAVGDRDKALGFYERMFQTEPASEKACRWLIARYLSLDRRTDAVRTYERCERALSRELDLEPEEKTKKLYRSIISA